MNPRGVDGLVVVFDFPHKVVRCREHSAINTRANDSALAQRGQLRCQLLEAVSPYFVSAVLVGDFVVSQEAHGA